MALLKPKIISRLYLILVMLAAVVLSPLPLAIIVSILLLLQIYTSYWRVRPGLDLALTFLSLTLIPVIIEASLGWLLSAALVVPAIPLLDSSLKANAATYDFNYMGERKASVVLKTLSAALLIMLVISLITANLALTLTSALV